MNIMIYIDGLGQLRLWWLLQGNTTVFLDLISSARTEVKKKVHKLIYTDV